MYNLDAYTDAIPDLDSILQFTAPDELDTMAEIARLEERDRIYRTVWTAKAAECSRQPA